ncbi:MAG: hypothetical protein N2D54_06340 [Chloroflexota bacterium]
MKLTKTQIREEKGVRAYYKWLSYSWLITVPWVVINIGGLSSRAPYLSYVWAITTPAFVHLILLLPITSKNVFVKRHGQQAAYLVGARWLSTVFFLGRPNPEGEIGIWVLVNLFLILLGSINGRKQVEKGDCWLMRRKGETDLLPRPWADDQTALKLGSGSPASPEGSHPVNPSPVQTNMNKNKLTVSPVKLPPDMPLEYSIALNQLKWKQKKLAINNFMHVYRAGSHVHKEIVIKALREICEIEVF